MPDRRQVVLLIKKQLRVNTSVTYSSLELLYSKHIHGKCYCSENVREETGDFFALFGVKVGM